MSTPSNYDANHLYALLPAVYRQRDAEQAERLGTANGPLRDLVEILAGQAVLVERDIFRLYENWFVETCQPWTVPYLGDLIGVRGTNGAGNPRAEVANTLGYRQAKGTAAMLERLARDVTGWPARAVEYFALLGTTQHVNHVRAANLRTPDLRRAADLERLGGPFEAAAHTAEVRRIAVERGRYDIPNVGLFLWRLQAYPLERVTPKPADATKRNFTFDVLGRDEPLFHGAVAETDAAGLATELNVPAPIRRRSLDADLASYYGTGIDLAIWPAWTLPVGNQPPQAPLAITEVVACDLTDWNRPRPAGKVAVDPVLGRLSFLAFPGAVDPAQVRVSCRYGFSDDLGGGPYQRESSFTTIAGETTLRVGESAGPGGFATLQAALDHWNGSGSAVIEIADSRTYAEKLVVKAIPDKGRLELRAADGERPVLLLAGELKISGGAASGFEINGLLIAGGTLRISGAVDHVLIQHATLAPGTPGANAPSLIVEPEAARLTVSRAILGAVQTAAEAQASWSDAILDASNDAAVAYAGLDGTSPGAPLTVARCSVCGEVRTAELTLAENSLFLDPVTATRRQAGCVRFSYVAPGSRTPRRFHCQPTDETTAAQLRPQFTSLRHGDPGYFQLTLDTPTEIRRGADDESEMGAFASLRQPQREDALRIRLAEYLRVGLEAGIFFPT